MIRKVSVELSTTGNKLMLNKLALNKTKRPKFMSAKKLSLPAGKELKTNLTEQPQKVRVVVSSKCSEYEGYDYCTPLFP